MKNSKSALEARDLEAGFDVGPAIRRGVRATLVAMAVLSVTAPFAGAAPILSGEAYSSVLWGPAQVSTDFVEYAVDVTSTGTSSDQGYLNVVRNDGTWVVWNLAVGFEPGTRTIATQVAASLFQSGASFQTTIDTTIRAAAPIYAGGTPRTLGAPVSYQEDNGWGVTEFGPLGAPFVPPPFPPPIWDNPPGPVVWHEGMPDYNAGTNQCAPVAATNSLVWLDNKYNLDLPAPDVISEGLRQAMHTSNTVGTTFDQFLEGKKTFLDIFSPRFPIETHEVPLGTHALSNIQQELINQQDIELFIQPLIGYGGHVITLVGIQRFGPEDALISYVDPGDRKDQIQQQWVYSIGGSTAFFSGAYTQWGITYAVAESVPEPSTMVLAGLAAAALAVSSLRRRRHRRP